MAAMPVLTETYDAIASHRSWLISEPGTAPWLVRVALGAGEPKLAERAAAAVEDIAQRNPGFPSVSASADHASGLLRGDRTRLRRRARSMEIRGSPRRPPRILGTCLVRAADRRRTRSLAWTTRWTATSVPVRPGTRPGSGGGCARRGAAQGIGRLIEGPTSGGQA